MLPILAPFLLPALLLAGPADAPRAPQASLRFQKSFRLQVKPRPAPASLPRTGRPESGAVVEVHGEGRPLETVREQTLREFRDWIVANRFRGSAFPLGLQPVALTTASWDQTHPGGFTVAAPAPLGWGY
jgi:hypothetical protein